MASDHSRLVEQRYGAVLEVFSNSPLAEVAVRYGACGEAAGGRQPGGAVDRQEQDL